MRAGGTYPWKLMDITKVDRSNLASRSDTSQCSAYITHPLHRLVYIETDIFSVAMRSIYHIVLHDPIVDVESIILVKMYAY